MAPVIDHADIAFAKEQPAITVATRIENSANDNTAQATGKALWQRAEQIYHRSQQAQPQVADLPNARSPALSKIFRELQRRETQKTKPSGNSPVAESGAENGAPLDANPALAPARGALTWPEATKLTSELTELKESQSRLWGRQVQISVGALRTAKSIYDPTTTQALAELERLAEKARALQSRIQNEREKARLMIAAYGLQRRIDVWSAVANAASPAVDRQARRIQESVDRRVMLERVRDVQRSLSNNQHASIWTEHLRLEELTRFAASSDVHLIEKRSKLACEALARQPLPSDLEHQEKFLTHPSVANLHGELRRWVTQPIDLQSLVATIEKFEVHPFERHATTIGSCWNQLRCSMLPEYNRVADVIDVHYRNANVRINVTESFMNRLIPAWNRVRAPVREHILGAEVRGLSTSDMKMNVDLLNSPEQIRMKLKADGRLAANTQSRKGPVTLHNFNESDFVIDKLFVMNPEGVHAGPARALASGNSSIIGMRTRYDALPLFGAIVRRIAKQRAFETRPLQRRMFENRVALRAEQRVDANVSRQIRSAEHHVETKFIQPLHEMKLAPRTIDMSSSDDRAVYRGRLAGHHQLAACTARPKDVDASMLNMQMHVSALNNFLRQMKLDGQTDTIRAIMKSVLGQLDLPNVEIPEDVPDDVLIALADRDSVRVSCDDGRVCFTYRIAGLKADRKAWKHFAVRAFYEPHVDGLKCELRRCGVVELQGKRLSGGDQLALRAIFSKVFAKSRPIPMVHPRIAQDPRMRDLQVDQFVVRDGWIGMSIGKRPQPKQAPRQATQAPNRRRQRR